MDEIFTYLDENCSDLDKTNLKETTEKIQAIPSKLDSFVKKEAIRFGVSVDVIKNCSRLRQKLAK